MSPEPGKEWTTGRLGSWLSNRLHMDGIRRSLDRQAVPVAFLPRYFLGGAALFFLLMQAVTGVLLMVYYEPTDEGAHASIVRMLYHVGFGPIVRSLHRWSAHLMVGAVLLHLVTVFYSRAYRPPREMTWFAGLALLGLVLGFSFTGHLLPWDVQGYYATQVGAGLIGKVPVVGEGLRGLILGGDTVTGASLTRMFALHVGILPLLTVLFLGAHLWMVHAHGIARPLRWSRKPAENRLGMPFGSSFLPRELLVFFFLLNVLLVLAVMAPVELTAEADPFASTPGGIRPEWYFSAPYEILKRTPARILGFDGTSVVASLFPIVGLMLLLLPFVDRSPRRRVLSGLILLLSTLMLCGVLALTIKSVWF